MKLKKQEQRFKNAFLFTWQKFQLISPAAFTVQKYRANVGVSQYCQTYNGKGHGIYAEKNATFGHLDHTHVLLHTATYSQLKRLHTSNGKERKVEEMIHFLTKV